MMPGCAVTFKIKTAVLSLSLVVYIFHKKDGKNPGVLRSWPPCADSNPQNQDLEHLVVEYRLSVTSLVSHRWGWEWVQVAGRALRSDLDTDGEQSYLSLTQRGKQVSSLVHQGVELHPSLPSTATKLPSPPPLSAFHLIWMIFVSLFCSFWASEQQRLYLMNECSRASTCRLYLITSRRPGDPLWIIHAWL